MEIPLKPISLPHNFTIPPKLKSQSKKPDTETQLRDRQTDRQRYRQTDRETGESLERSSTTTTTDTFERRKAGRNEKAKSEDEPEENGKKKQWVVVVLLCEWEMWVQDRQMRRKKGSREEKRGSRLQRSVAVTAAASRESEREAKVFEGGGGRGRDCGVRAAATTASKSGRR
jgi:hypothetical protein